MLKYSLHCVFCIGVFALLYMVALLKRVQTVVTKSEVRTFFVTAFIVCAGIVFLLVVALTYLGKYCASKGLCKEFFLQKSEITM